MKSDLWTITIRVFFFVFLQILLCTNSNAFLFTSNIHRSNDFNLMKNNSHSPKFKLQNSESNGEFNLRSNLSSHRLRRIKSPAKISHLEEFRTYSRENECDIRGFTNFGILQRIKKIRKWNTYRKNRYKRTTNDKQMNFSGDHDFNGSTDNYLKTSKSITEFLYAFPRFDTNSDLALDIRSSSLSFTHDQVQKRVKRNTMKIKWPIKRVVSVQGDVIIGGLMMVHSRGAGDRLCGPIMAQGGVQALEVMLYTLQEINKDPNIPFRIGAHILDDCDTDTYGLEMALDFIKANLHYLENGPHKSECSDVSKPIWGVVGAPSSITSIQVSNLLRLFKIPMISPFSTSPELSNKHKFDYFCRTIPSDYYQVQVIAKIVDKLEWTYVSIIYEESNYGIKGLEELERVLNERKVCIAIKEKVLKDSGVPNEAFYDKVVVKLLTKPLAKGVIVFASDQEVAGIMRAVKRLNITNHFSWIGSDGWSARNLVSEGNEDVVEGTISVQPQANPVEGFDKYFFNRKPMDHLNPYFAEYWETNFECRLPYVPTTPFNLEFKKACNSSLKLDPYTVEIENQLQFVHQATNGFCKALVNMHHDLCGKNFKGVCDKMWKSRGPLFLEYIKYVNFTDFSGDEFQFDQNGDGPARYNILHYKKNAQNHYKWVRVGKYENGTLNMNIEDLLFKYDNKRMPVSSCSRNCEQGQMKKYANDDKCCWKCIPCAKYEVVFSNDETECKKCVLGTKPDADKKSCIDIEALIKRNTFFRISVLSTTIFGFFNVIITFVLYTWNVNSAIVKASSREAQFLILVGAAFLHVNAYSFLFDPNEVVCSMQSYLSGIGYILIYGTLFWKSYRIVRIFDLGAQCKNLNSSVFVLLVLGLCCIQKIKSVVWTYFVDPRRVTFVYPNRDTKIKLCSAFTTLEFGYFIAYIFPFISIVFCYMRTKKMTNTPKVFDDSLQIFFSIRFTISLWMLMFIIHFTTSDILFRQNILALITNFNGIMAVFVLFYKSLLIILFRPHMNTREYLRASRANHTMKSQCLDESQHTRRKTSHSVINESGLSDGMEETSSVAKKDVSIQYSFTCLTNLDAASQKSLAVRTYSLNNRKKKTSVVNAVNGTSTLHNEQSRISNDSTNSSIDGDCSSICESVPCVKDMDSRNKNIKNFETENNILKCEIDSMTEIVHEKNTLELCCNYDLESSIQFCENDDLNAQKITSDDKSENIS